MDDTLVKLIDEFKKIEDQFLQSALKDLFGLGLYLHASGKVSPGLKTCQTFLRAIGFNK